MLHEYSISDLLAMPPQYIPYYAGTFEETEDPPDIKWPHRHSFYSLVWFTQGSGFYVIDFIEYAISPNRIFFVSPKQVHNWNYTENSKGYILVIDGSHDYGLNIDHEFPFIDLSNADSPFIETVFKKLISEYQAKNEVSIDIQYFYKLLERYTNNKPSEFVSNSTFDKFKQLVRNNLNVSQSVEEYANSLNSSVDELNAISKQISGISAKQYLLDVKMTEAKRLLIFSTKNISEISCQLGFEDSSYFARLFKKKTTLSPTDFLRKYRK